MTASMTLRTALSTMVLGVAVVASQAAVADDTFHSTASAASVASGHRPGHRATDVVRAAEVEADQVYTYFGKEIRKEYWKPFGFRNEKVIAKIAPGTRMMGYEVLEYVQHGVMNKSATLVLRKAAVVGLVAGALGAGHGSAEASTVRMQPEAGKPIPLSVTSNVGEANNSFESFAGETSARPSSTGKANTAR